MAFVRDPIASGLKVTLFKPIVIDSGVFETGTKLRTFAVSSGGSIELTDGYSNYVWIQREKFLEYTNFNLDTMQYEGPVTSSWERRFIDWIISLFSR